MEEDYVTFQDSFEDLKEAKRRHLEAIKQRYIKTLKRPTKLSIRAIRLSESMAVGCNEILFRDAKERSR